MDEEGHKAEKEQQLMTCPFDPRFPHVNQTKHCFISFVDFHKCSRLLGDYEGCQQLKQCYRALCPNAWVEKWEEQIERGTFPVQLPKKREEENEEENGNGSQQSHV